MDVANNSSKMDKYWVDSPNQCHYDRNLNFTAIGSEDDEAYSSFSKKTKSARDPQSHRIIEKRRRDRMNNCLADLSRLLPAAYMKKGRGRIEKTEIIEMTIKHMKHLQVHACKEMETCEIAVQMEQLHSTNKTDQYRSGFLECITETVQFIGHHQADHHGPFYAGEEFCSRLVAHLHNHYEKIGRGEGSASETGDYTTNGVTPPTLAPRSGHATNLVLPNGNNDDEVPNITPAPSNNNTNNACATPIAVDPYNKLSHEIAEANKVKEERVQGMFNYLNGTSAAAAAEQQQQQHHRRHHQHHQQQHSNSNLPRSSPGSGGDSDESRSNRATRNSDTPSPVNPTTDGSSPTDMDNSSHSGNSNHSSSRSGTSSSQLRQMLLASNGESSTTSRTKSCSSSSSSSRSNTTQQSTDDASGMYKFKTNIHQRFTADLEHVFPPSSCLMTPSSTSSLPEQQQQTQQQHSGHHQSLSSSERTGSFDSVHGLKRKKMDCDNVMNRHNPGYTWNGDGPPPPPSSPISRTHHRSNSDELDESYNTDMTVVHPQKQASSSSSSNLPASPAENVPIFALHPKGAFYVPMSVELPLIRAFFNPPPSLENAQPALHPVTISVNFCCPLRVLTAAALASNDAVTSIHHSSVIQPPVRIPRPEMTLPGLVPAPPIVHQRHHPPPYDVVEPLGGGGGSSSNCYPLAIEDSRLRNREHSRSSLVRHHEEMKMLRAPQRAEENGYHHHHTMNGNDAPRREYVIRSSREHGNRSPAVIPTAATHSSRWSHLMAKRTHTP